MNRYKIEATFLYCMNRLVLTFLCEQSVKNKAGYTAEVVASCLAGALMQKLPGKRRKSKCVTDRPTDGPTQWGIESRACD